MPAKTIKTGPLFRTLQFERGAIDKEKRTVELTFASEFPVERYFGLEILDCRAESVDLSRLNGGGAVSVDHNSRDQVGVVVPKSARMGADRKGHATVRFGKSARAEEIFQDVCDEIRGLVSNGYRINKMVIEKSEEGVETYRATSWMPFEISFVAIPADAGVGVGRAEEENLQFDTVIEEPAGPNVGLAGASQPSNTDMKRNLLLDAGAAGSGAGGGTGTVTPPAAGSAPTTGAVTAVAPDSSRKVAMEIIAIGEQFRCMKEAMQYANEGKTVEQFRQWVMENKFNAKPVDTSPDIGLSRQEVKRWSLTRALHLLASQKPLDGLEKETNEAMAKRCGFETQGVFVPNEIVHGHPDARVRAVEMLAMALLQRDLSATGGGNVGGYTIQTDVLGGSLIELLRNMMVCFELGVRKLGGLQGDVAVPSQSGGATAYWVDENQQTAASALAFGQVGMVPHRVSAVTILRKRLLAHSSVDVEGLVREDLARVLAIEIDRACLAGAGNNGEPVGIMNTVGIGSVTFGAAADWAHIIDFETQVANANALLGGLAYVTTPSARAKLKAAAKIGTTFPNFIWENGAKAGEGEMNGYRALATKQVPGNKMVYGNWPDAVVGDWIGMDVVVDPYSVADKHQVKTVINMLADVAVRHAGSFCASTDSAAQ